MSSQQQRNEEELKKALLLKRLADGKLTNTSGTTDTAIGQRPQPPLPPVTHSTAGVSKTTKKQLQINKALERRKQLRRIEKTGGNISTGAITHEILDERTLQNNLSRIISMLPGSKKKRPPPTPMKDGRTKIWKQYPRTTKERYCPWYRDHSDSLTDELKNFMRFANLDVNEENARKQIISDLTESIQAKWPQAVISVFGSYPAGLSTFISDIDISILGMGSDDSTMTEAMMRLPPPQLPPQQQSQQDTITDHFTEVAAGGIEIEQDGGDNSSLKPGIAQLSGGLVAIPDNATHDSLGALTTSSQTKDDETAVGEENAVSGKKKVRLRELLDIIFQGSDTSSSSSSDSEQQVQNVGENEKDDRVDGKDDEEEDLEDERQGSDGEGSWSGEFSEGSESDASDADDGEYISRKRRRTNTGQAIDVDMSLNTSTSLLDFDREDYEDGGNEEQEDGDEDADFLITTDSTLTAAQQLEKRKRHTALLKVLFAHLRVMNWMYEGEFRHKAKVPIIYITHRSGIGCDVSMGVTAEDTSNLVSALKAIDADAFVVLSAFLKMFLFCLALDKPYSGGIGSYKLYVMIGFILDMRAKQSPKEKDYGLLLLRFLRYFSLKTNFNKNTTLRVCKATATFEKTMQVDTCQLAFEKAYKILMEKIESSSNSSSILSSILDCEYLFKTREIYARKCMKCAFTTTTDRNNVAHSILRELQTKVQSLTGVTVEDIRRSNPCLYTRLCSYQKSADAFSTGQASDNENTSYGGFYKKNGRQKQNIAVKNKRKLKQISGNNRRNTPFPPQNYYLHTRPFR